MGNSRAWTYKVVWTVKGQRWTDSEWRVKDDGRPTYANLENYVEAMQASFKKGGTNSGHARILGTAPEILAARLVRINTGEVLASYAREAPKLCFDAVHEDELKGLDFNPRRGMWVARVLANVAQDDERTVWTSGPVHASRREAEAIAKAVMNQLREQGAA